MDIGKYWKIESDSENIILKHLVMPNPNNKMTKYPDRGKWVNRYYSTPKAALRALVNQEVKDTELTDLTIVVNKIDELYELIEGLEL